MYIDANIARHKTEKAKNDMKKSFEDIVHKVREENIYIFDSISNTIKDFAEKGSDNIIIYSTTLDCLINSSKIPITDGINPITKPKLIYYIEKYFSSIGFKVERNIDYIKFSW